MGIFDSDVDSESLLTDFQSWIEELTGQNLATLLQGNSFSGGMNFNKLDRRLRRAGRRSRKDLKSVLRDSKRSGEAFEQDAFRSFDENIAPRIDQGFAKHGASLGSRRGFTTANALADVQSDVNVQKIGLKTSDLNRRLSASSVPLQQMLSQIQGMGQLQQMEFAPIQLANQFLSRQSQQLTSQPGLGQQGLQLAGLGLGAGLFGQSGPANQASGIFRMFNGER